jgi:hypothetical protein
MAHRAGFHPDARLSRVDHLHHQGPIDRTEHLPLNVVHRCEPRGLRVDGLGSGPPPQLFLFQDVKPEAAAPDTAIHFMSSNRTTSIWAPHLGHSMVEASLVESA